MKTRNLLVGALTTTLLFSLSLQSFAMDATEIATGSVVTAEAGRIAYEAGVIKDTVGRAGADTLSGAKGIVFESMYKGKENFKNITSGIKTNFTKSSTASQVDLVAQDSSGKVVRRMQLKDTPSSSGVVKTLEQVESGKYNAAQMVGTTETAEAYNANAAAKGIGKVMKDSGISTETTSRIASKSLGKVDGAGISKLAGKGGAVGAVLSGGTAAYESYKNGDDIYDATGNVTTATANGAITGTTCVAVGELVGTGLAAAGVTGGAAIAAPFVATVGAGIGVGYGIDKAIEYTDADQKVSDFTKKAAKGASEAFSDAKEELEEAQVAEKVSSGLQSAGKKVGQTAEQVSNSFTNAVSNISK